MLISFYQSIAIARYRLMARAHENRWIFFSSYILLGFPLRPRESVQQAFVTSHLKADAVSLVQKSTPFMTSGVWSVFLPSEVQLTPLSFALLDASLMLGDVKTIGSCDVYNIATFPRTIQDRSTRLGTTPGLSSL